MKGYLQCYTWENIFEIQDMMVTMQLSDTRNVLQAIMKFLVKLETEKSDRCIVEILELEEKQIQRIIESVL